MKKEKIVEPLKTTKRWLYQLNQYRQAAYSLREMLKCVDGLEGVRYNGMPSSGKIGDPTLELVARRDELELRLRNTERIVNLVDKALDSLNENERLIVEKRYVQHMAWKTITKESHYTRQGAFKVGQRGLNKVCESLFSQSVYI